MRDREIEVTLSDDEQVHIQYSENSKEYYDISVSDGNVLTMVNANNKEWTDYIGGKPSTKDRKIVLQMPTTLLDTVTLSTTNEDISLPVLAVTGSSYKNAPAGTREDIKKKYQNNKLNLQGSIQNAIAAAYRKENPKITHFYNNVNYNEVPIWAIFEILTMGDFGYLLSCLTIDMREKVSRSIGINLSSDTYRELLYKYVYALKDLRNAIAHNDVVYDTRFKKMDPSRPMKQCLILEMGMPYINFKTIGDYIILICYYLKLLKVSKTEIKSFIREFEKITREYEASVNPNVSAITIHPDLFSRLGILKNAI